MILEFSQSRSGTLLAGKLIYRSGEFSLDYQADSKDEVARRAGKDGVTSLTIGTLQLEIGIETRAVLFPWGYCPRNSWHAARIDSPKAVPGAVLLNTSLPLAKGVSLKLDESDQWVPEFDAKSGWLRIGPAGTASAQHAIEFAAGCVMGLTGKRLGVLWLQPVIRV